MDPLLEINGLSAGYSTAPRRTRNGKRFITAVDDVSLVVRPGELVALVGESGSGKTTVAQSVVGLVQRAAGWIAVEGEDLSALGRRQLRHVRMRVQLVFQDPYESLDPRFRIGRSIEEPLAVHRIKNREERHSRVMHALERVGLTPAERYAQRRPHELSGGQRQRAAIAAGLVLEPVLLIADEPVSMLDVSVRASVLGLLAGLKREARLGILMVTHDLSTAALYADRILVMYAGRLVEGGPTRMVINDPWHPYTEALLAAVPERDRRPVPLGGDVPDPSAFPAGCRFSPRCPIAQKGCEANSPQLEANLEHNREVACFLRSDQGNASGATSS